jgi:signal transduction histidine kinase
MSLNLLTAGRYRRAPALAGGLDGARAYAVLSLGYFLAYLGLNCLTESRSLGGSSITLWSPDNALSVMLIMESWTFTPVVWLAQLSSDLWFGHFGASAAGAICGETTMAAGYLGIGMALRHGFGIDLRAMRPRDLVAVMAVAPLGAAITGFAYCGALWALGDIKPERLLFSYASFCIGDAAAMGALIPAAGALLRTLAAKPWRRPDFANALFLFTVTLLFLALVIFLSASTAQQRYLFNLTYLPILLIGIKFGFDAGVLTLLFVQLCLISALQFFHVGDRDFGAYQMMMFILSVSGQALGVAVSEWEAATAALRREQAELAKLSERATNGVLAAAMSHEISQPLASIAAYVFSARRLLESGRDQGKALTALRKAEGEAGRARAIVERLRDFVANGAAAAEEIELGDLVATILRLQSDAAEARGVRLRRAGPDPGPLRVAADRVGVEQALANLVLNALEAAPQGRGEVLVRLERRGEWAALVVEDNGPGVAAEVAERLFEPFETTKPRGMGLGLPLAKEIAARCRGRLSWRPVAPHGARFELELPLA